MLLSTLLSIFCTSAWVMPKPCSQDFSPESSLCSSSAYCGSRLASRATPMMPATIRPMMIAYIPRTSTRVASQRGAPRRIIMPRNGSTVITSTRARNTGPRMFGTACMPAATITPAARPSTMINPRGRP